MKTVQEISYELCEGHTFVKHNDNVVRCSRCGLRQSEQKEQEPLAVSAHTEFEPFDLTQIPFVAEKRIGAVFSEGTRKYGRDNWCKGVDDKGFQIERANHALKHLRIYVHWLTTGEYIGEIKNDIPEDDIAKVAWFCCTQMEIERLEAQEGCYEPS